MAFDISKAAYGKSSVSNLDKIRMIPLDHIEPNEKNFYELSKIEDLMESIRMVGLLDPVRVVPMEEPGYYRLVSGHRRYDAFLELDAETPHGQTSTYARIPALVLEDMDDLTESFALITANSTARELTYNEKLEQEKQLRATLLAMKAEGRAVPKNLGQYIADQIGVSRNEVSRMHSVNENLIPEAREKVAAGEMTAQQAYEMSRKPEAEQRQGFAEKLKNDQDRVTKEVHAEEAAFMERIEKAFDTLLYGANFDFLLYRKDVIVELRRVNMNRGHWGSDSHFAGSAPTLCIYPAHSCADGIRRSWTSVADAMSIIALRRCAAAAKEEAAREQMAINLDATSDLGAWRHGKPARKGSYVCAVKLNPSSDKVSRRVMWWYGAWCVNDNPSTKIDGDAGVAVLGWIALPEEDPE